MRRFMSKKGASFLPQEIRSAEVLPLVEQAADESFNSSDRVKKALAVVGANPLNRNRLDKDAILRTAPEEVQEERRRILSQRNENTNTAAKPSGMLADLLNEGSGYLLGGGNAAKVAIEDANKTLCLEGNYVENVFDLVERKRSLIAGRNKHMEEQADKRTVLQEQYAKSSRMTAGTVFGTGNGMLQEEVRDEIRRREQRKKSKLDAAQRKQRKKLWNLCLEVEQVREFIHVRHRDHFRSKGVDSSASVTESDLLESHIRKLNNGWLKTLVRWKRVKGDDAIPTNKDGLATRLIATMGRRSPQPSPYNSDDEDNDEEDEVVATADGEGREEEYSEGEDGDEDDA